MQSGIHQTDCHLQIIVDIRNPWVSAAGACTQNTYMISLEDGQECFWQKD